LITHKFRAIWKSAKFRLVKDMIARHKKQLVKAAHLGDQRLHKRLGSCFEAFAHHMEESIPSAMQDIHQAKAVYRFYENDRVSYEKLVQAERQASLAPCDEPSPDACQRRLFIQDTTELDFTGTCSSEELGCLNYARQKGMYLHNHLAVSPQGIPIGLFAQSYYQRSAESLGQGQQRKYAPIQEKESYRWLRQWQELQHFMGSQPDSEAICIADREADIHELLQARSVQNCHYLIRSKNNRKLADRDEGLWGALAAGHVAGHYKLAITDAVSGKEQRCQVAVRYGHYSLQAPYRTKHQGKCEPVSLYAIEATGVLPNGKTICWRLLSSYPVNNIAEAKMLIRYYSYRWRVERLHYILKSGARIEKLQLATARQLQSAIALFSMVSVHLLQLTHYARIQPAVNVEQLGVGKQEWRALQQYQAKGKVAEHSHHPPSIGVWIKWLTALVGFKASKRQPWPGVKRLWKAMRKWNHIYQGFLLAQKQQNYG
jgi:hypothetical protein